MAAFISAAKALKASKNAASAEDQSSVQHTLTIQSATSNKGIDCPFNLDEIFQADVDRFGTLKDVIKFIIENLEKNHTKTHEVETKMISKFMQIDK